MSGEGGAERRCVVCGVRVPAERWHPVAVDSDAGFAVRTFCGQDCREAWLADQDAGPSDRG